MKIDTMKTLAAFALAAIECGMDASAGIDARVSAVQSGNNVKLQSISPGRYLLTGGTVEQQRSLAYELVDEFQASPGNVLFSPCCNQQLYYALPGFPIDGVDANIHYRTNTDCTTNFYQTLFTSSGVDLMMEDAEILASGIDNLSVAEEQYRGFCGGEVLPLSFYYPDPYLDSRSTWVTNFVQIVSYYDFACNPSTALWNFTLPAPVEPNDKANCHPDS